MKSRNSIKRIKAALFMIMLVTVGMVKAQTQEFAPVGAEWHYERLYREGWNYTGIAYDRFRSLRTVVINGWECKEIELYQHLDCDGLVYPYTEFRYITQEGNQVYEVEDGQRFLLYDFSKKPGESWYTSKYDVEVYVIDTSTLVLEDGSIRKILHTFTFDDYIYFTNIVEGIGMDRSVFPFYDWDGPPPCVHGQIRCYSEDGLPLVVSGIECDYEILSVEEQECGLGSFTFHPNPTEGMLRIEGEKAAKMQVYNPLGQLVKTVQNANEVSLEGLPQGVYLLRVTLEDGKVFSDKVVKE